MYFWAFIYFMESSRVLIHPISSFHIYLHTKRQIRLPLPVRIWGFRCDIVIWRLVFFFSRCMRAKAQIIDLGVWAGVCVSVVLFFFIMLYFHLSTLCLSAVFRGWIQPPGIDTRGRGRKNTDILYFSYRIWAEWMLSILLLLNLCYPATRRQYLYQERGCASKRVCVCVAVCLCVYKCACVHLYGSAALLDQLIFSHLRSRVRIIKPISRRWLLQPVCDWITTQLPAISSSKGEKERAEEESREKWEKW